MSGQKIIEGLEQAFARIAELEAALEPFSVYFTAQEKQFSERGCDPALMPDTKKLHSIPISAWRKVAALAKPAVT